MPDLTLEIAGLKLDNPVMVASGTFGYAREFESYMDLNRLGAIITKTVTLEPRPGNPPPRIAETPAGMLNSIGLPNVGVERFCSEKLPYLTALSTRIVVNVAGKTGEDFVRVVERLDSIERIDAFELNYSCPNVKQGGLSFSADPVLAQQVTRAVRQATRKPIFAKLTPNVTSISDIGLAVQDGGADAVSAINTFVGMSIDVRTRRPVLSTVTGGLSGPAIRPLALAKVYELCKRLDIPVIAIGGIMSAEDALEFFFAGAKAVQVGTANFVDPDAAIKIIDGLDHHCRVLGVDRFTELIGTLDTGL